MKFNDTHVNEAALSAVDANAFDMAMLADESGKPARYLYSSPRPGTAWSTDRVWERLIIHVADVDERGAPQRLLDALKIELLDVPF